MITAQLLFERLLYFAGIVEDAALSGRSGRRLPSQWASVSSLLTGRHIHTQYNEGNTMKQHVDINRMMGSKPKGYA